MKCLTVLQPWAMLLITGVKRFETRTWRTAYRGPLAIHAGRIFPEAARALCRREPFRSALLMAGFRQPADLPIQAVLGTVDLIDCVPAGPIRRILPADCPELRFGDFRDDRWAWRLENPVLFPEPRPAIGRLGIFNIPELATP